MTKRVGMYYWAGPGTERMIRLKYFSPKIDTDSLSRSYDLNVLREARDRFGVTDAWVTYSWGFSDAAEQEDYAFLERKLENFRTLDIRTHAYVQGTNLVYADFKDNDYYCKDFKGRLIPYHRGRKLACPNNPFFRELIANRVERACKLDVDGVYIDNFHFGQIPAVFGNRTSFVGCACDYCLQKFGHDIPIQHDLGSIQSKRYLQFRADSLHGLVRELSSITLSHGKSYGSNSYDINYDTELMYGFSIPQLAMHQDYIFVENHCHPAVGRTNRKIKTIAQKISIPIFVISYKKPIGSHSVITQNDINLVHSESRKCGYFPCYKATEYKTKSIWHNLDFSIYIQPQETQLSDGSKRKRRFKMVPRKIFSVLANIIYIPMLNRLYEKRIHRFLFGWILSKVLMHERPSTN